MKSTLLLLLFFVHVPFQEEVRVISYSSGKINSPGYENLSFWIKDGKRAYIQYSYGKDLKDLLARYLGPDTLSGRQGFKTQIPGKPVYYILPEGTKLIVRDRAGKYLKHFTWEREERGTGEAGDSPPVNDTTAAPCDICAADEQEAMHLVLKYFLR